MLLSAKVEKAADFPVHWISKEARYKIIEFMLSTRSVMELARQLGISPTAVRKYIKRISHPSDEVLLRAIASLAPYEKEAVLNIITDDLINAISKLYSVVDDNYKAVIRAKIMKAIGL